VALGEATTATAGGDYSTDWQNDLDRPFHATC
jgi:hypothetical protein